MNWIAMYLVLSIVIYGFLYADAVVFNFRMDHSKLNSSSFWKFLMTYYREIGRIWCLDFLKIHCPWSKETSIKYRVQEAHRLLQGMTHEKGWTAEDCHNPRNHNQIAHDCFQSRTRFWLTDVFIMLTSPIRSVFMAVVLAVALVIILMTEIAIPLVLKVQRKIRWSRT